MSNVRIELNSDGVQELLHNVGASVCAECAQQTANACGEGYEADVHNAGTRTIASVYTKTEDPDEILRHLQ